MRVVSIDPHPSSDSVVCMDDGNGDIKFLSKTPRELREFVDCLAKTKVLLCWDAPLTGPSCASEAGPDFYWRQLECFFAPQARVGKKRKLRETNYEVPAGISVLPYAGCPHWAITRSLLGLPRMGRYDQDHKSPFRLLTDPKASPQEMQDPCVVEIHPAVAAWLWSKGKRKFRPQTWFYKATSKKKNVDAAARDCILEDIWTAVVKAAQFDWPYETPKGGDCFDAAIGYLLGMIYLQDRCKPLGERKVDIVGSRETGAWLLPMVKGLNDKWERFWRAELERRKLG